MRTIEVTKETIDTGYNSCRFESCLLYKIDDMNPQELRIGNYITSKGQIINGASTVSKIVGIQANGKTNAIGVNWVGRTEANDPIPITEEWLIKFDFLHSSDLGWFIRINGYEGERLYIYDKGGCWHYQIGKIDNPIEHIHQLQNLYFALTQKELE